MERKSRIKRTFITALKISVGSCMAMYIAELMNLDFAVSAGSVTLLTILTTKWETLKLSLVRIVSFVVTVALSYILFEHIPSSWVAYGLFLFIMTVLLEGFGWRAALSVNALICTHFLATDNFSPEFILNEFLLVVLGVSIAVLLNLFNNNTARKKKILEYVASVEISLGTILGKLAEYLLSNDTGATVWEDIKSLERDIENYINLAHEYQNNTFSTQPGYYIDYFEMRSKQCGVLHSLHYEMERMRGIPKQAEIVADYIMYMKNYITEPNDPKEQLERLEQLVDAMKKEELPKSRKEFEDRALLYHILMDLEEFLKYKQRFIVSARKGELKNTKSYIKRYREKIKTR